MSSGAPITHWRSLSAGLTVGVTIACRRVVVTEINAVLEAIALFHTRNIANLLVIIIRVAKASVINLL